MSTGTLAELESAYRSRLDTIRDGVEHGIKVDGQNVEVKQEDADALKKAWDEAQEIKSYITMARGADGGGIDTLPAGGSVGMQAEAQKYLTQFKSVGELLTESKEYQDMRAGRQVKMDSPMELEVFDIGAMNRQVKDVYSAMNSGSITRTFGSIQFDPTVPRGQRRARVRDLFPVAATSANLIDFFQVLGFVENQTLLQSAGQAAINGGSGNAGPVPDYVPTAGTVPGNFGLKRKSNLQFASKQAPVRTIAHWEAAHRNVLDDEPQLQATINNELLYGLALEEDYQILSGTGANEDLLGILNTPNIQVYAAGAGELKSDTLRKAATLSIISNYPSTGYVLNPIDWERIEIQKGSGDGQYMLFTNISIGAAAQVWRQPVVETAAMTQGTFLSGAFGTGAQLYDRQQANIRIADQHSDLFVRNALAILAEERLALAVKRPESFIKGTFATS